jgi:predicted ABC-type ATPase
VATAGGPGASKSTILENYIKEHPQADFAYVDPDQAALKYMFTYIHEKSNDVIATHQLDQKDYAEVAKRAYNKWRAASNFIANTLLNEAVRQHLNISHGTTSTGNKIEELHQKLKQNGYKIVLLLCGSSDANREASLTHREQVQAFYQSTHSDCVEKGKLFYVRFPDYFTSADEIEMYWTDNFLKGSQKVATFNKKSGLTVIDADGFNKFKKEYEDNKTENYPPLAALTAY